MTITTIVFLIVVTICSVLLWRNAHADAVSTFRLREVRPEYREANPLFSWLVNGGYATALYLQNAGLHLVIWAGCCVGVVLLQGHITQYLFIPIFLAMTFIKISMSRSMVSCHERRMKGED